MAKKPRDKNQTDDETDTTTTEASSDDEQKTVETPEADKAEKAETTDADTDTGKAEDAQPAEKPDDDSKTQPETDEAAAQSESEEADEKPGENDAQPGAGKLFTQDDVNRIVAERLKRASMHTADPSDLQTQAAKISELQTQLEALTAELEARRQAEQVAEWKSGVAAQYGVPADLLRGDSLEALTAHAMQLAEYLKPKTDPVSLGNEPASANVIDDDPRSQFARQIYRLATQ